MPLAFAAVLVFATFVSTAHAQDICAPVRTSRCAVLPAVRVIPRFRPAGAGRPAPGAPSHRAALTLDRAWNLAEALPEIGAPEAVRAARDALLAIVAEHAHIDGLELGSLRARWPTEYTIRLTIAELSWRIEDLDACVEHFERVVHRYPDADNREDSAYVALLCHRRRVRAHSPSEPRGRAGEARDLTEAEQGFVAAVDRFSCLRPGTDEAAEAAYYAARTFYDADRYGEAAVRFRAIAEHSPESDLAEYAANLYLDSLNLLGRIRPSCHVEMADAVGRLTPIYCGTRAARDRHLEICATFSQLRCDLSRREAEALGERGDHLAARDAWLRIARGPHACVRGDEALFNASRAATAAGDAASARAIRVELRGRFPESRLGGL